MPLKWWTARKEAMGSGPPGSARCPPEPAIDVPEHLRYLSDQMVEALQKLQSAPLDPLPWPEPWQPRDCAWLSHRWGELLPLPTPMKYRLLALREPLLRLELVGDMVSPQTPAG
jgi:Lon protease-like protein